MLKKICIIIMLWFGLPYFSSILYSQNYAPQWAVKINGVDSTNYDQVIDMAVDKHGNSYSLIYTSGSIVIDGIPITDTTAKTILISFDCNGIFRWKKTFGGFSNNAMFIEVDTSEGVYVAGYVNFTAASQTAYWDSDTSITSSQPKVMNFLLKYDSQGQMQWFKTISSVTFLASEYIPFFLIVTHNAEIYWGGLLDAGTYDDGTFSVNSRKYYAIQYNAAGAFQASIPFVISVPPSFSTVPTLEMKWDYDPVKMKFYAGISYYKLNGSLAIGTTTILQPIHPTKSIAVLASFNKQGNVSWVRQASTNTYSYLNAITVNRNNNTLYIGGISDTGTVLCGDTAVNLLGDYATPFLMALDTNGNLKWSQHAASNLLYISPFLNSISNANNTIMATGHFKDSLVWGNKTVVTGFNSFDKGFIVTADAATGIITSLDTLSATGFVRPDLSYLDKNSNLYITGLFIGKMKFANDSITSSSNVWSDGFIVKYKNANCNCNLLQPSFNVNMQSSLSYKFTYNGGTPFTNIKWDFGDGTTQTSGNSPTHTYSTAGNYPVCVTVTDGCGSNTVCKYVNAVITDVSNINLRSAILIYPNPANELLIVENLPPDAAKIEVIDLLGKCQLRQVAHKAQEYIHIKNLAKGFYILNITNTDGEKSGFTFVKE